MPNLINKNPPFCAKLSRCGVVADIHIQHYPTMQIPNIATAAATKAKNTAANQDIPILVENAWNHRLQNVQMLPRYQIQT